MNSFRCHTHTRTHTPDSDEADDGASVAVAVETETDKVETGGTADNGGSGVEVDGGDSQWPFHMCYWTF